jgi:hypothetical protein
MRKFCEDHQDDGAIIVCKRCDQLNGTKRVFRTIEEWYEADCPEPGDWA